MAVLASAGGHLILTRYKVIHRLCAPKYRAAAQNTAWYWAWWLWPEAVGDYFMSAAEGLAGTAGGFCQGGRGHGWHHSMALPMVGGNERLMERPGGANLSAIAGGCWAWGSYSREHSFA